MTTATDAPFQDALAVSPLGDGRYGAELGTRWTIGAKAHGGLLMALLSRAGVAAGSAATPGTALDALAVSADYLRAPDPGPVVLETEVLKTGRTVSVVSVRLRQDERLMLASTVSLGRLPADEPLWSDLPGMAPEPPDDAIDPGREPRLATLAAVCDLRYDRTTCSFLRGEVGTAVQRGWARPRDEPTGPEFALLAGDILAPTVFNVSGSVGWAPTVQLTALLRGRPAPGWLRIESRSATVVGGWFDESSTVVDAEGRLVCQARQLALSPSQPS